MANKSVRFCIPVNACRQLHFIKNQSPFSKWNSKLIFILKFLMSSYFFLFSKPMVDRTRFYPICPIYVFMVEIEGNFKILNDFRASYAAGLLEKMARATLYVMTLYRDPESDAMFCC